ncbi:MAG: ATP synthase F1 subunit gamma [Cytophagales bacterium]|nr:ATP synthase F1 subunit gamma [Cytophagales bacterium]
MANLKEIKGRITSVKSTQQITKAMKMVAASKLRRAQDRIEQIRPYADKLGEILENVSSGSDADLVYSQEREINKVLLVVVSSDRGLCGGFNSGVFKRTLQLIEEKYQREQEAGFLTIMPIGKKALEFFKRRNFQLIEDYALLFGELSFDTARPAAEQVMRGFVSEEFDKVDVVYNEFKNAAIQILKAEQFLPIKTSAKKEEEEENEIDFIFEPSKAFIIEELIPKSLKLQFYKVLLDSSASEQGARMTAMEQATDNAGELLKELQLTYNRTRQAAITTEILEIVAGAEALSQGGK